MILWVILSMVFVYMLWYAIFTSFPTFVDTVLGIIATPLLIAIALVPTILVSMVVTAFCPASSHLEQIYDKPIICATDVYDDENLHYIFTLNNEDNGTEILDIKAKDAEVYNVKLSPHIQKCEEKWDNVFLRVFFVNTIPYRYMVYVPDGTFTHQGFEFNLE